MAAVLIIQHDERLSAYFSRYIRSYCGHGQRPFHRQIGLVSFIVTLAMLGIAQGVAYLLTNGQPVAGFPSAYGQIGRARMGNGFPVPALIAFGVIITLHIMLTRTRLGLHLYAVGSSTESAAFSGIRPDRLRLVAFMISGVTQALVASSLVHG